MASPERPRGSRRSRAGTTVVIIDDHPMWRETLGRVIEDGGVGIVVDEAADGERGIQIVLDRRPSVVIMDINLPGLDGHAATRHLVDALPGIRILVLSASDEQRDVIAAMRAGAVGYLLKTAQPTEVVDAIKRVVAAELVLPPQLADVVLEELRHPSHTAIAQGLAVLLADRSPLFRSGLARVLEEAGMRIVGEASSMAEVADEIRRTSPAVLVLDAAMAAADGSQALDRMLETNAARILLLADRPDEPLISTVLEGAVDGSGCLLKGRVDDVAELADAVCRVAEGGSVVDPAVTKHWLMKRRERDPLDELTDREHDVLKLMAEGRSNQAISERLFLSPKSVEAHVRNIFTKLGLEAASDDNRRVLAVLAYLSRSAASAPE